MHCTTKVVNSGTGFKFFNYYFDFYLTKFLGLSEEIYVAKCSTLPKLLQYLTMLSKHQFSWFSDAVLFFLCFNYGQLDWLWNKILYDKTIYFFDRFIC